MKKDSSLNAENSRIQRWTIDDLRKKLERDRLKYTHSVKHDAIKRTMIRMNEINLKTKETKEA